jgi:hypothetical protein
MKGFISILTVLVVLAVTASDASAQLFGRRGGGCNAGGCSAGGGGGGCNVGSSGSQGCNISQAPQPTRASAEDLLQSASHRPALKSLPLLPPKEVPLKLDAAASLAFCAPVEKSNHRLDLEKIVYRQKAPSHQQMLRAVAAR